MFNLLSMKVKKRFLSRITQSIALSLIFSLLLNTISLLLLPSTVYAASSPWTQTDWSGGSGQTSWSDTTKYDSTSGITTSTAGQATITNTENFSNTGFETDLTSWSSARTYDLQDQFTTALAAGAVNGTIAEPTGGTRTVTDTESKLSIASAALTFAGGKATPAWGDPGLWYSSVTRTAGKTLLGQINVSTVGGNGLQFGFPSNTTGGNARSGIRLASTNIALVEGGSFITNIGTYSTATQYNLAVVLRSTGAYLFIKGGSFSNWTLLWVGAVDSTSTLYPAVFNNNIIFTADNIAIPTTLYTPVPLVSDGFSASTTDGSGNAENNGTTGTSWTGSTWTVSGGSVSNSPTAGSELLTDGGLENWTSATNATSWTEALGGTGTINQETTTFHGGSNAARLDIDASNTETYLSQTITNNNGDWISVEDWMRSSASGKTGKVGFLGGTGQDGATRNPGTTYTQYTDVFRANQANKGVYLGRVGAASASIYHDDVSAKALTLSSLFRTIDSGSADALVEVVPTVTAGTQGGLVLNLDSTSSPANFIIAYHDGTSVKVDEAVAGIYTNKATTTTTYSSTAVLRAVRYGTSLDVYYNNAKVGSTLTMTANTNTLHGLFSTYSGNTFDNFVVWDRDGYTDAPFEELTATYDTGTTYNSSAGSAKLVASGVAANFTQSVNVGNTQTHQLSAYAYTDGSAVTSADLSLLSNGSTISTTYTSVGGGWYQLTGTLTGAASSIAYGVQVKAGKTVYIDNASLTSYAPTNTLISSIYDTGQASNWGAMNYHATTTSTTGVQVKVRSSNSSTMSGATAFSSCSTITDGADLSTADPTCIADGQRYLQYQLTLTNTDNQSTPTFQDITINYSQASIPPSLESPNDNSYTNQERPSFRWKAGTSANLLSSYQVDLDNGPTGDFSISSIPASRTTTYETTKYNAHYEGFSDSDTTNNYITVYTKSSSDWGPNHNDGKLKEGKRSWTLKAIDATGVEYTASRTLFVDLTSPTIEVTQVNDIQKTVLVPQGQSLTDLSTTDTTPTITGKITDPLSAQDGSTATQDENGPKIASGPKQVEIKVEKQETVLGVPSTTKLITLYTINLDSQNSLYTCDDKEITDNSKNKCDKYQNFTYTPATPLDFGTYKITVTGTDKADNGSASSPQVLLTIGTLAQLTTPEEKEIIEEELQELPPEQQEQIKQGLEVTKPIEPHLSTLFERILTSIVTTTKHLLTIAFNFLRDTATLALRVTNNILAFVFNAIGNSLAFIVEQIGQTLAFIGNGYTQIANSAPGVAKTILLTLGDATYSATNAVKESIANAAFVVGEKVDGLSNSVRACSKSF